MAAYLEEVRKLEKRFLGMGLKHVPRSENKEANELARRASHRERQPPGIFEERLQRPSAAPAAPVTTLTGGLPEEIPLPPQTGGPDCGLPSGARLLLALEPQANMWAAKI